MHATTDTTNPPAPASAGADQPIIRGAGEGERRWFAGGGVFTMKATAAETNGAFFLIEDRIVRGKSTPLHLHPHEDETLIVLEGELLVSVGGPSSGSVEGALRSFPAGCPTRFS